MATPIRVGLLRRSRFGCISGSHSRACRGRRVFGDFIAKHVRLCAAAVRAPHHFEVAENGRGYWVAEDKEGLIGGVFRTQKDALRFALFEAAGDSACVKVISSSRH